MSSVIETLEWEGEHTRLVKLDGLKKGPGSYRRIPGRRVKRVFIHQSAGNFKEGIDAPLAINNFHIAPPVYKLNPDGTVAYRTVRGKPRKWWVGGGRGWPGAGYTFNVPAVPAVVGGRFTVYRFHDDDVVSYHTGGSNNTSGAAVCVSGYYRAPGGTRGRDRPGDGALVALRELVLDYLIPRYGLSDKDLRGHFDAGKRGCPGLFLEQWVRHVRGEDVPDPIQEVLVDPRDLPEEEYAYRPLESTTDVQQALVDLGYDLGPYGPKKDGVDGSWGFASRGALEAFQDTMRITVDGDIGDQTIAALRYALGLLQRGMWSA